jgi:hypothetical protein
LKRLKGGGQCPDLISILGWERKLSQLAAHLTDQTLRIEDNPRFGQMRTPPGAGWPSRRQIYFDFFQNFTGQTRQLGL